MTKNYKEKYKEYLDKAFNAYGITPADINLPKFDAKKQYDEEDYLCGHISVKVDGTTSTYYQTNTNAHSFLNINGMITLFPCYVYHWTDQYNGDSERITLAFDIKSKKLFDIDIHPDAKWSWVKI